MPLSTCRPQIHGQVLRKMFTVGSLKSLPLHPNPAAALAALDMMLSWKACDPSQHPTKANPNVLIRRTPSFTRTERVRQPCLRRAKHRFLRPAQMQLKQVKQDRLCQVPWLNRSCKGTLDLAVCLVPNRQPVVRPACFRSPSRKAVWQ